jgi:hypothetical protein
LREFQPAEKSAKSSFSQEKFYKLLSCTFYKLMHNRSELI